MLFHASTHAAAAHRDSLQPLNSLTRTAEALAHKTEAIRLINQELSRMRRDGGVPDEALLIAVCSMTAEPEEVVNAELEKANFSIDPRNESPFTPPSIPKDWHKQFARIRSAKYHQQALWTLVQMRGGIGTVKSLCVVKSLCL